MTAAMQRDYEYTIYLLEDRIETLEYSLKELLPNTAAWLDLNKRIYRLKHDLADVQYQVNMARGKIDFWL